MADNELYNIKDVLDYQIFTVAKQSPLSYKELYQIAYLGYLKAQKNFDPAYGKMSLSYASRYIRQELIETLRKEYKEINHKAFPKYGYLEDDAHNLQEWLENQPAEDVTNPTSNPVLKKIERLLLQLPDQQADIIEAFYLSERPKRLVDLARERGVSKQRIHYLKQQGLEKLRELLEQDSDR